jgi:hypothetical protein
MPEDLKYEAGKDGNGHPSYYGKEEDYRIGAWSLSFVLSVVSVRAAWTHVLLASCLRYPLHHAAEINSLLRVKIIGIRLATDSMAVIGTIKEDWLS